jgi:hypothetical protein
MKAKRAKEKKINGSIKKILQKLKVEQIFFLMRFYFIIFFLCQLIVVV